MEHQSLAEETGIALDLYGRSITSATYLGGAGVDMKGWDGVLFLLNVGTIAGSGTVDMKIQSAAASGFGTPHDITGAALVEVAQTGQEKLYAIDVQTATMIAGNAGDRYMRSAVAGDGSDAAFVGVIAIRYRRNGVLPQTGGLQQLVKV